tara:strand:- start:165 stop:371 length:207 start_codon:yes stop_codon:yes gene_type:complete
MLKSNKKLKHNISVSHQIINTEIKVIERLWLNKTISEQDIVEHIEQLKKAVEISKQCLDEHYKETELV